MQVVMLVGEEVCALQPSPAYLHPFEKFERSFKSGITSILWYVIHAKCNIWKKNSIALTYASSFYSIDKRGFT